MYSNGIAAMVAAISRAWASRESWATTSTTRPQSWAVSASMKSPVKLIRRARSIPMSWGRRMVSPPPGITPTLRVGVGEARPFGRDEEVAGHGQLQTAGHGRPVDRTDDRGPVRRQHAEVLDRAAHAVLLDRPPLGGQ